MAFSRTSPTLLTSRGVSLPQSFGFSLLACSSYHWQLSFLRAEQVLLEQLDEDGGCRRKCFQALRQMKEDVWCPGTRPVITSYHLQVRGRPQRRGAGAGWVSLQCVCVCVCVVCGVWCVVCVCGVCVCVCVCVCVETAPLRAHSSPAQGSRLLFFPPPPFLLPVPLLSYSLSVLPSLSPSLSLSLPLFHSTNQPKCPLRASNPAEVEK